MWYGRRGKVRVRRRLRPRVLHSDQPPSRISPSFILNWKNDPSRAFQTPKRPNGKRLRLAAQRTALHYCSHRFAEVREDTLA